MKSKLLVPLLALLLAACGGGDGDGAAPAPAPIPADALNPQVFRTMSAADDQFCFHHAGVFSQRGIADPTAFLHPEIIHTTFDEEVICNDRFGGVRTFVILTGELVS